MKLIAQVKLRPTPEQTAALRRTMQQANAACEFVSKRAWQSKTFRQYDLHRLLYREVRDQFGLSAQAAVRVIAKVADAYKLDRQTRRQFKLTGSVAYDDRILSWRMTDSTISIWTVIGRLRIPFLCGAPQRELLKTRQGESDLIWFREEFFLSASCEIDEPIPTEGDDVLGIDLGVVNLAVDSDGNVYSSKTVNHVRYRHRRLRTKLQKKGTLSTRRLLQKLSGKESRFAQDVNHTISKQVVQWAKDTHRDIAVEDLTGIRERVTARRPQRAQLASWSFFQLRSFLEYKSTLAGVRLHAVDPRNTSRTCPECGGVDKRNRSSQEKFQCIDCGHSGLADRIAARNIAGRARVNLPYVSRPIATPSGGAETSRLL